MSEYQKLKDQVEAMILLINFLAPNKSPFDLDYIEANIVEGKELYEKVRQINIFKSLEIILFDKNEFLTFGIIQRILKNLSDHLPFWKGYYNRTTYKKAQDTISLYKSDDLHTLIVRHDSVLRNVISEIKRFSDIYFDNTNKNELNILIESPAFKFESWYEDDDDLIFSQPDDKEDLHKLNDKIDDHHFDRPKIKDDAVDRIIEILKDWFTEDQLGVLKEIIASGKTPTQKLTFKGNGKTLLDFFKKLWKGQFLTIASQKDLEKWISNSFNFYNRGKKNSISPKYASSIISSNNEAAKGNRLINIEKVNGKLEIIQCELSNREKS